MLAEWRRGSARDIECWQNPLHTGQFDPLLSQEVAGRDAMFFSLSQACNMLLWCPNSTFANSGTKMIAICFSSFCCLGKTMLDALHQQTCNSKGARHTCTDKHVSALSEVHDRVETMMKVHTAPILSSRILLRFSTACYCHPDLAAHQAALHPFSQPILSLTSPGRLPACSSQIACCPMMGRKHAPLTCLSHHDVFQVTYQG